MRCLCSTDAGDDKLDGYGSDDAESSTDNRVRPMCTDDTASLRDTSPGLKTADSQYTEWRRKKWTTLQYVNRIYVNCCSTTVSFSENVDAKDKI